MTRRTPPDARQLAIDWSRPGRGHATRKARLCGQCGERAPKGTRLDHNGLCVACRGAATPQRDRVCRRCKQPPPEGTRLHRQLCKRCRDELGARQCKQCGNPPPDGSVLRKGRCKRCRGGAAARGAPDAAEAKPGAAARTRGDAERRLIELTEAVQQHLAGTLSRRDLRRRLNRSRGV
jgi:hypothetical protein